MANPELLWDDGCEAQLKIVLLGGRNSAKSWVGNVLLGREEFVTRERTTCSKRQGVLAGRWLSVVDTPGWWCDFGARDTAQLVKREIAGSVLLCFPGPHVFLLVVKACSPFTERRRAALEQHVALLGEGVWRHCILLLTCVDGRAHGAPAGGPPGDALAWLAGKCGQRWHRLALSGHTVGSQVIQLFVKMQTLAANNANRPFELEPSCLRRLNRNIKTVEERALQRFLRMKERRAQMQEDSRHISDLRVVLIGATGSGKTSVAGAMVGGRDARRERGGARREAAAAARTARCRVHHGAALGRDVTAVDTPGWWTNYFAAESSAFDRWEIARGVRLCPPGPHALLLVVRVDRAFTDTHRRAAQEHLELLLGPEAWGHTLLVFSFGDWLGDTSIERYVESEGEPLRWLVERCGHRYHVMYSTRTGDAGFQVAELVGKVEEMVAANKGRAYQRAGGGVAAGHLEEQRRRAEEVRAAQRLLVKTEQRQALRSQLGELRCVPEMRLVLLGGRNTGKTSCGDTILGRVTADDPTAAAAAACLERRAHVRGVAVTVLDTSQRPPPPASHDHDRQMTRQDVTSDLSALLLVVNVSASFTSSLLAALEEQMLGGAEEEEEEEEGVAAARWSRAMVLFSHGDWLGNSSIEERIESEGQALRRLVDRCGNRYHVLDNRHRGDRSQVYQLLDQVEEMLVGARLALIQRGDPIRKSVTPAVRHGREASAVCQRNRKMPDVRLSCTSNPGPLDAPVDTSLSCQVVARPEKPKLALNACREVSNMTLWTASSGLRANKVLRWTLSDIKAVMGILSNWSLTAVCPHDRAGAPCDGRVNVLSPPHRGSVLAPPCPHRTPALAGATEDDVAVAARSHRPPRDDALRKLFQAGDLQALIDQWGSRSLEELEAFVDAHFEMVWERAMGSAAAAADDVTELGGATEGAEQNVISSIMEKLSKLHLLEDIQRDLTEVKQSLDRCWRIMQELMEAHRGNQHRTEEGS